MVKLSIPKVGRALRARRKVADARAAVFSPASRCIPLVSELKNTDLVKFGKEIVNFSHPREGCPLYARRKVADAALQRARLCRSAATLGPPQSSCQRTGRDRRPSSRARRCPSSRCITFRNPNHQCELRLRPRPVACASSWRCVLGKNVALRRRWEKHGPA